jgi:polyvinyl alcohol dehydrogenase (cytochrome)
MQVLLRYMQDTQEASVRIFPGALAAVAVFFLAAPFLGAQPTAPSPVTQVRMTEGAGSTIFGNTCENCHGNPKVDSAPSPAMLKKLTPEKIYQALTTGDMVTQAKDLTDRQKRDIAEWVGGRKLGSAESGDAQKMPNRCESNPPLVDLTSAPAWNGWSDINNTRFQPAKAAGLSVAAVSRLRLRWAFGAPSAESVYGQPTVVDGRVFFSSDSGWIYSLDAATGCVHWSFQAQTGVRSAVTLATVKTGAGAQKSAAFFGDIHGNVYSVDATNGELIWKQSIDPHPLSRITGGVRVYKGRVYVPVASLEEPESSSYNYKCCTFRGMVAALNADTGKQIWKTYTIDETPTERKTAEGKSFMGPAGAGVWSPVAIDPKHNAIYVTTGNTFSAPDVGRSDGVMAIDLDSGKILWMQQDEAGDVWHTGCPSGTPPAGFPPKNAGAAGGARRGPPPGAGAGGRAGRGGGGGRAQRPEDYYCPSETENPDWDFSAGVILVNLPNGKRLLLAGQKSGMVWAHDPDQKGALVWRSDVSRGQIVFGGASDGENAYYVFRSGGGGVVALGVADGVEKWFTPIPAQESMNTHTGLTAGVTAIPGAVFTAGLDGVVHAFRAYDGQAIWQYDTTQEVKTVNGMTARGGSIGSAGVTVAGGMVFVPSGYTGFQNGQPGNLLLAFAP